MSENHSETLKETTTQEPAEKDFSGRYLVSYMVGVYVAVNAIRDAFLLVEGPDCTYMKNIFMQGNQDYLSSLVSVSGYHKIANTALHPSQIAGSRENIIKSMLSQMAGYGEAGSVILTSMPMAYITGVDYDRICREAGKATGKEVFHVPGKSLSSDWLNGYEETLYSIAKQIDLSKNEGTDREEKVALVGLLYDRNEEDVNGNIREIQRILKGMGLDLVCVWLCGKNFSELKKAQDAGTIISLPYGRRAAKVLATRLNAKLIETDLPFGLTASERWARKIGKAFMREKQAEAFIDSELQSIAPKLEWIIPFLFQNRGFGYVGDPFMMPGYVEIIELLGGEIKFAVLTNCKNHLKEFQSEGSTIPLSSLTDKIKHFLVEETSNKIRKFLNSHVQNDSLACIMTNTSGLDFISGQGNAIVEIGFPAYNTHALHDSPYLGFNGFLAFISKMSNAMRIFETFRARR